MPQELDDGVNFVSAAHPRAKFLLSGLGVCSNCGSRYEGYTRYGNNRGENGSRRRTFHYACGGYIRHGRSMCTLGAVPKDALEEAVIKTLVDFYARYAGKSARKQIAKAVGIHVNEDSDQIVKQRKELESRLKHIDKTTRNLLDNITATNRQLVDQRLEELNKERERLETQIESLERLAVPEAEVHDLAAETARFVACLEPSLCEGPLDQRQAAVRRCVDQIVIDREKHEAKIEVRVLPTSVGAQVGAATETVVVRLPVVRRGRPPGSRRERGQTGSSMRSSGTLRPVPSPIDPATT